MISPHYPSVPGRFGVLGDRRDVRGVLLCSGLRQEEGAGHILYVYNSCPLIHTHFFISSIIFLLLFPLSLLILRKLS